ncbi:hypothetical protein G6F62_014338 [Rhizopus arrhizus]|nr:hypothetical protein G6F20_014208 [Rhizopus arrhizus]KAG1238524.1 hypothetical protein G6F68_018755 [Rhizopus microsporus]KAG0834593.1 hypothetical protein G6F17_013949 [Rhizopus arrhizus]KAG0884286.1 hypothetical protein G6F34_013367 [Rhizopus arrhizus]KAG0892395.1 hypothetical protein G6F33_013995 [Rhizopus arrhizus]
MSSNTDDQLAAMQQRLLELEQFITQQQQAPAQPSPEHNESMTDIDPSLLHSFEVRPSYTWQPSPLSYLPH